MTTRALTLLVLLAATIARADDWPQRAGGPAREGRAGEALTAGLAPAWSVDLGEPVEAGPALADGVLVVVTWAGRVRAFDEAGGQPLWTRDLGVPGCAATPACARGRVVVARGDGAVVCLALATGDVLWQRAGEGGPRAAVAVADDLVVASLGFPGAELVALDLATGAARWSVTLPELGYAHPAVGAGLVVVGTNDGQYRAFDAASGAPRWTQATAGAVLLAGPTLAGDAALLLPGGQDARLRRVALDRAQAALDRVVDLGFPPPVDPLAELGVTLAAGPPAWSGARAVALLRYDHVLDQVEPWGEADRWVCEEHVVVVDPAAGAVTWRGVLGTLDAASQNEVPPFGHTPSPVVVDGPDGTWVLVGSSLEAGARFLRLDGTPGPAHARGPGERWAEASAPAVANGRVALVTRDGVVDVLALPQAAPGAPTLDPLVTQAASGELALAPGADADDGPAALAHVVRLDDDGEVLRDWDHELAFGPGATRLALPPGVVRGRRHVARGRARDPGGAWSTWSAAVEVLLDVPPDPPARLRASADPTRVDLAWDPSPSPAVAGYSVRHRERPGGPWSSRDVGAVLAARLEGLTPGVAYDVEVAAFSQVGRDGPPAALIVVAQAPVLLGGTPFQTLAAALGAARPGDVVTLGAGDFALDAPAALPDGVTVRGASARATRVALAGGDGLRATGAGARVERLALSGGARAVVAAAGATLVLDHVLLFDHEDALVVEGGARVEGVHVTLVRNERAVHVAAGGELTLVSSIVTGNDVGVDAAGPARTRFTAVEGNGVDREGDAPFDPSDVPVAPLLTDPAADDFRETAASSAVDTGDPDAGVGDEPWPHGGRVNLGAFGGTADAAASPRAGSRSVAGCALAPVGGSGAGAAWLVTMLLVALLRARTTREP